MHKTTIKNHGLVYQVTCSCGERSPLGNKQDVEDWERDHGFRVQRLRARLGKYSPSLKASHDWYLIQANNPDNTDKDRTLWRMLADELEARLHLYDDADQPHLW